MCMMRTASMSMALDATDTSSTSGECIPTKQDRTPITGVFLRFFDMIHLWWALLLVSARRTACQSFSFVVRPIRWAVAECFESLSLRLVHEVTSLKFFERCRVVLYAPHASKRKVCCSLKAEKRGAHLPCQSALVGSRVWMLTKAGFLHFL